MQNNRSIVKRISESVLFELPRRIFQADLNLFIVE